MACDTCWIDGFLTALFVVGWEVCYVLILMLAAGKLFPINLLILANFAKLFFPDSVMGLVWTGGGGGGTNFWEFWGVFNGCVIFGGLLLDFGWSFLLSFWIRVFL